MIYLKENTYNQTQFHTSMVTLNNGHMYLVTSSKQLISYCVEATKFFPQTSLPCELYVSQARLRLDLLNKTIINYLERQIQKLRKSVKKNFIKTYPT